MKFFFIFLSITGLLLPAILPSLSFATESWTSPSTGDDQIRITVSSVLPPKNKEYYGPKSVGDKNPKTAWCDGTKQNGMGEWIRVDFAGKTKISSIYITNGYPKSRRTFANKARAKKILISAGVDQNFEVTLKDTRTPQKIRLPHTVDTSWIKVTIKSAYPGAKHPNVCLGEIGLRGEE